MVKHLLTKSTWVFDLDNTLYPPECNLFAQVSRLMTEYVAQELGIDPQSARQIQKSYYQQYGTTLRGMMIHHQTDPREYLDFVHNIDYDCIEANPNLVTSIQNLPADRVIFTNGSRRHAEKILARIGLSDCFSKIVDIEDAEFIPKPHQDAFGLMVQKTALDPQNSVMVEDLPRNLEVPANLGMSTVLVEHGFDWGEWENPNAPYIHHRTRDLSGWLSALLEA